MCSDVTELEVSSFYRFERSYVWTYPERQRGNMMSDTFGIPKRRALAEKLSAITPKVDAETAVPVARLDDAAAKLGFQPRAGSSIPAREDRRPSGNASHPRPQPSPHFYLIISTR